MQVKAMTKKVNTLWKFLETEQPLAEEAYFSPRYYMVVYWAGTSLDASRESLRKSCPFGDPKRRKKFFEKCLRYIAHKEPRRIKEFLFYDTRCEQGMIMAFRPDSLKRGTWCLSVMKVLPIRKIPSSTDQRGMKFARVRKLLVDASVRWHPRQALEYVLELMNQDDLKESYEHVRSGKFDGSYHSGEPLRVYIENCMVNYVSSPETFGTLKLVEV